MHKATRGRTSIGCGVMVKDGDDDDDDDDDDVHDNAWRRRDRADEHSRMMNGRAVLVSQKDLGVAMWDCVQAIRCEMRSMQRLMVSCKR